MATINSRDAHTARLLRVLGFLLTGILAPVVGAARALSMDQAIQDAVQVGELRFQRGELRALDPLAVHDVHRTIDLPMGIESGDMSLPAATVPIAGAPSGHLLTRSADGCWRLPALGHCWRAVKTSIPISELQ